MAGVKANKLVDMSTRLADLRQAQAEILSGFKPLPEPTIGTPEITTPILAIPEVAAPTVTTATVQRRVVVRQEVFAQDGQTAGETATYGALWDLAEKRGSTGPSNRRITIGYGDLAREARQSINTVKANLKSLKEKLAIDAVEKFTQSGTAYTVYGYREILARRKAAGFTHYIKMNGSTQYINPTTGVQMTGTPKATSGIPTFAMTGIPTVDSSGVPKVDAYLYRKKISKEIEEEARRVLSDPEASENDRLAARSVLGEN